MATEQRAVADGAPDQLRAQVRRGLSWSVASSVVVRGSGLVSGIVMARLLSPRDFGVFAVATVALVLIANLNDLGLEQSLVRWPGSFDRVAPTAATIILAFSLVLFAVFYVAAPVFSTQLGAPDAAGLIRLLAVGLLFNGVCAVPSALLTRSFAQDKKAYSDLTGIAIGTVLTIVLAVLGFGAWSLAWGRVVGNAVNSAMQLWFAPRLYRPAWSPSAARSLLRSGLPLAGATIIAVAVLNIDYVLVGRLLGPVALGLYVLAFNLASWPYNLLSKPVARVSVPAFARLQHEPIALERAFCWSLALMVTLTAPLSLLLAVLAGPAIQFLYGSKWGQAAGALVFLAVLGLMRVSLQLCFELLVAVGRSRAVLMLQVLWLAVLAPALALGAHLGGIRGVGVAHVGVALVVMMPAFALTLRGAGLSLSRIGTAVRRPVLALPLVLVGPVLARTLLEMSWLVVLVGGTAGLMLYLPAVAPVLRAANAVRRGHDVPEI